MTAVGWLLCEIDAWVDDAFPGFVRVRLVDADGRSWHFVDKVPIFRLDDDISPDTSLPRPAAVRCSLLGEAEEQVVLVSTAVDNVEAEEGTTQFRVRLDQLES